MKFDRLSLRSRAVLVGLAASPVVASAQGTTTDVSSVTAVLTAAAAAGATIGLAYLAMSAGIKLYKWIRTAM
jgi:Inovirus Coat protein B